MRLGLAFREPNISELQRRVTSWQFGEWLAYERLAPLAADDRLHELVAHLCAILASVHRKKDSPGYEPDQFMPWRTRMRGGRPRATTFERDLKEHITLVGQAAAAKKRARKAK